MLSFITLNGLKINATRYYMWRPMMTCHLNWCFIKLKCVVESIYVWHHSKVFKLLNKLKYLCWSDLRPFLNNQTRNNKLFYFLANCNIEVNVVWGDGVRGALFVSLSIFLNESIRQKVILIDICWSFSTVAHGARIRTSQFFR